MWYVKCGQSARRFLAWPGHLGEGACQLCGWAGELPSTAGSWCDQTVPNLQLEVWCAAVEYVEYLSRSENSSPRKQLTEATTGKAWDAVALAVATTRVFKLFPGNWL